MSTSANLILPYLAEGQAQKHVTLNESLRKLDAIVQIAVESATTSAEPGAPSDGQVWILPAGKTGTNWSGFADDALGYYRDGAWEEIPPKEGWLAWVRDVDEVRIFDGASWTNLLDGLGLGSAATSDTGTSGANVPLLNGANTWSAPQEFTANKGVQVGPGVICYDLGSSGMVIARNLYYDQGTSQYRIAASSGAGFSAIRLLGNGIIQIASASGSVTADAVVSPTWRHITKSSAATGGSGSAGSGNQYVELDINGTTYKVLHDGTV